MSTKRRKFTVTPESLLGCRFFDHLDAAERSYIVRYCDGRCYANGAEIVRHRDIRDEVFFIVSGSVKASLRTPTGREVTSQVLTQGNMFGELSALDGEPRSTSVVAIEDCSLLCVSGCSFNHLLERFPSLSKKTMQRLCALSRFLCARAFQARVLSIPEQIRVEIARVASMTRANPGGPLTIDDPPTHEEIAQRVGTNREQVTRVMSELEKSGLLARTRRRWRIPDPSAIVARSV